MSHGTLAVAATPIAAADDVIILATTDDAAETTPERHANLRALLAGALGIEEFSSGVVPEQEAEEEEVWTSDDEGTPSGDVTAHDTRVEHGADEFATPLPAIAGNVAPKEPPIAWPDAVLTEAALDHHYDLADHPASNTAIYAIPLRPGNAKGSIITEKISPHDYLSTEPDGPMAPPRPSIHRGPVSGGAGDGAILNNNHYQIPSATGQRKPVCADTEAVVGETAFSLDREKSEAAHLKLTIQDITVRTLKTCFRVHIFLLLTTMAFIPVASRAFLSLSLSLFLYCVIVGELAVVIMLVCSAALFKRMLARQYWDSRFGYWLSHKDVRNYHFFTSLAQTGGNLLVLLLLLGSTFSFALLWAVPWIAVVPYAALFFYGRSKENRGSVSPYWLWGICAFELCLLACNIAWLVLATDADVTRLNVGVFARNVASTLATLAVLMAVRPTD